MKPAAREARPPGRSPGLRRALRPLLLLSLLGQILCQGSSSTFPTSTSYSAPSPTSDSGAGSISPSPSTLYDGSITAGINENLDTAISTLSTPVTTDPDPVSSLHITFMGLTAVVLTWENRNGTATYQLCLENIGSHTQLNHNLTVNLSNVEPGAVFAYDIKSDEAQGAPMVIKCDSVVNRTESSALTPPVNKCQLPEDSMISPLAGKTQVLLLGLKPGMEYKATVFSLEPIDAEQHKETEFRRKMLGFVKWLKPEPLAQDSCQVTDIEAANINATNMTLTWKINDTNLCSAYTYNVEVIGGTDAFNLTINETQAILTPLSPSTLYSITVRPFLQNGSEGIPGFLQKYTRPGPVSDFRVTTVNIRNIGLAWSSNDTDSFKIVTMRNGTENSSTGITNQSSIVIGDLYPGTNYCFEIFPQGPNGTEGDLQRVCNATDPSEVLDLRVTHVTTTEMKLEWQNSDKAPNYTYYLDLKSEQDSNQTNSSHTAITLRGLVPGTLYNITVVPEVDGIQGLSSFVAQYTRPSNVSDIDIHTNTTAATISWQNSDEASPKYTYRLLIGKEGDSKNATEIVTGMGITYATVTKLTPGSEYKVEVFTYVGDATASLAPGWQTFCTDPAPVASFHCEVVPKMPALILQWACPAGTNAGFQLEVSRGDWTNTTDLEGCSLENGTEYRTEVTYLNFSTSYDINVTALSCNKKSSPTQNTCTTGITDPPPPDGSPNITSISHNSVKVKFSGFEDSHGPIRAYAVILTTGEANPSAEVLSHTYEDFKRGASATYVTYLIATENKTRSQDLSEVLKYEINVGNESTTHGYYNGKLEPLGSYRACVAGFTNITFITDRDLIDGNRSYVSFSRYSDAVSLPQDPGVICGAVFGCIFGAMVIVAVGGFIFWRKKRKDAKHNEVSFSQIKPKKSKLIRVENFEAYFKKQQADSNCGFAEEYEDLKFVGTSQPKYSAELAENRGKNRYNNVLPYDISRVRLSVHTHSADDYINANYMPGYHSKKDFIATQGPLPNTLKDYWRMVWEKNVYAIVMLTKCVEQGRTKCEEYWPSKQAKDYGSITVAMTSEIVLPEWTIRDFTVKNNQTSDSHPLRQFHFTSWPDHGVPDTTDLLINFRYLVRDYMKQSPPESPILVHCSAGVGRTGTFIAIDRLIYQIENENAVDVYGIVYDLRMHRPLMVQTEDQYVFLNQCVLDIIRSQRDSKVDLIYQNTTAMTIYENLAPVAPFGQTNGYIA